MADLVHRELSYRIIGILYKIYNTIGGGLQEKYYQKAMRKVFEKNKIPFLEQVRVDLDLDGVCIGRYYLDFVIEGYLKKSGLELGILAAFTSEGIKFKRILRGR